MFGSIIVGLLVYTLTTITGQINSLDRRMINVETKVASIETKLDATNARITSLEISLNATNAKIDALAQRQSDFEETLSVLLAVLNVRREVEAAKAHEINGAAPNPTTDSDPAIPMLAEP